MWGSRLFCSNGLLAPNENALSLLFLCARMASLTMSHIAPSHFLTFDFILKHLPRMKLQFGLKVKYLSQGQIGTHAFLQLTHLFLLMALRLLCQSCRHRDQLDHCCCAFNISLPCPAPWSFYFRAITVRALFFLNF